MDLLAQYARSKLDLSSLGLARGPARSGYFCAPVGAHVIGWAGVDGVHFCTVRGLGGTVFAVSPANGPGDYVHPVAASFEDFLRLILACGGTAAIEQAHGWDEARFAAYLEENAPDEERRAAMARLAERFALAPMEEPYRYIRALQAGFNYRALRFGRDYAKWAPPELAVPTAPAWEVRFGRGFFGRGRERPGREVAADVRFAWAGEPWSVPAYYVSAKGITVDLCVRLDPVRVRTWLDKWRLAQDETGERLTREQRMRAELESPLAPDFRTELELRGRHLTERSAYGLTYVPDVPELSEGLPARWVLEHYGLDLAAAWSIRRIHIPWATVRPPRPGPMTLTLRPERATIPGPRFQTPAPGQSVTLAHPMTGQTYTLTVQDVEPGTLARPVEAGGDEYPARYLAMTYTLSPELAEDRFQVTDCDESDPPRRKPGSLAPQAENSVVVAIIGGAAGPTAVASGGGERLHAACSSLRFETPEDVQWRMDFMELLRQGVSAALPPWGGK